MDEVVLGAGLAQQFRALLGLALRLDQSLVPGAGLARLMFLCLTGLNELPLGLGELAAYPCVEGRTPTRARARTSRTDQYGTLEESDGMTILGVEEAGGEMPTAGEPALAVRGGLAQRPAVDRAAVPRALPRRRHG